MSHEPTWPHDATMPAGIPPPPHAPRVARLGCRAGRGRDPDNYLYTSYYPGHPRNMGKINDPVLTDLLIRQRRLQDPAKRRQGIHGIQRLWPASGISSKSSRWC